MNANDNPCKKPGGYIDISKLSEDERIEVIGKSLTCEHCIKRKGGPLEIGVALDDDAPKVQRYVQKLKDRFGVRFLKQVAGPVEDVVTVVFGSPLAS